MALTIEQVRSVDRIAIESFGMQGLVLMENAGRGAADWINSNVPESSHVLILCGGGNNGGDGLVIARHLHAYGRDVRVVMIADRDRLSQDCRSNLEILERTKITIHWFPVHQREFLSKLEEQIQSSQVLVDALLGTGSKGNPRGMMAVAIHCANAISLRRIAIDIPSGLDADSGEPNSPTLFADTTLTFVDKKVGMERPGAQEWTGEVHVLPIGIPTEVLKIVFASPF